jgi:predicted glycogen debranching enzyme
VGGVILKKEKLFVHYENRILIRYTLLQAQSPTKLRLRPFLAFRSVREFTHENAAASRDYQAVENGIKTCMYPGYPELFMQLNKKNEFVFAPDWYRGIEYPKELERGYDFNEDLYVPGYFEMDIKMGESIVFSAGISEIQSRQLKKKFDDEAADRVPRKNFFYCLKNSAHQFHNKQDGEHYILAGYPWFKCRARDMFVSLPGLTLAVGEKDEFEDAMNTAEKAIRQFIAGEPVTYKIYQMEDPDVLLWAIWALQQYAKETSHAECRKRYGKLMHDVMDFFITHKHENAFLHDNGLLYTNGTDKAVTWMNSEVNGHPVIPRSGYVVEVNALWYNALRFVADLAREEGEGQDTVFADVLDTVSQKTGQSFVETFRNEYGYLLDYVDGNMMDWSVRPNMIFTVAFDYSPLDRAQKKQVLDIVTKELLTPKGLRTLSPKSTGYNPNYVGSPIQRDYAYHQGTAWPWLMGFYMEAYLRIYKRSGLSFVERHMIGMEDEMTQHCVGSLPELFDGNPPFKGRGAVSFAMNVAETLRTLELVEKYNTVQ